MKFHSIQAIKKKKKDMSILRHFNTKIFIIVLLE